MDPSHFDTLARSLYDGRSRRAALASLLGGSLGLLALVPHEEAEAKKSCPPCKKRKRGKCKKKLPNGTSCGGGACQNGRCVAATCSDGIKNGSETGVDCGGSCPRCANGQSCASRNDCASALCLDGTCQTCSTSSPCGTDASGLSCPCRPPLAGGPAFCTQGNSAGTTVTSCDSCPSDTICVGPVPGGYNCTRHCRAP